MAFNITIRFYEELNDFIKNYPPKEDIPFSFRDRRSVKDLIESFGVPHVEVDLILVNGESVDFTYIVEDRDRISVYPVFERLDIHGLSPLRDKPLRQTRFVLDVHLGRLARDLRMLGFDCDYSNSRDDPELAAIAASEQRILLTRDRGLLKRKIVTRGLAVRSDDPAEQLVEVMTKLDLKNQICPLTRCLECNGVLEKIEKETKTFNEFRAGIPPKVLAWCNEYSHCRVCGKIYWKGSHYDTMMIRISKLA